MCYFKSMLTCSHHWTKGQLIPGLGSSDGEYNCSTSLEAVDKSDHDVTFRPGGYYMSFAGRFGKT